MKILILSDIHGNIEALKSVKINVENENIEKIILLGDIIDYGPHSNEVIELLMQFPYEVICNIRGNHESAVVDENYERFSSERGRISARFTQNILNDFSRKYLGSAMSDSSVSEFEIDGRKCLAVHGSLEDTEWKAIKPGQNVIDYCKYDYVFSGHSHVPHLFSEYFDCDNPERRNKKRTLFLNPGSVGQPRNHNPRAQFSVWDTETDEFKMCAVDYDIETEQKAFSDRIDKFYKERLVTGV